MVDKKFDEKEALEIRKIYNHYLGKRKEIMKKTLSKEGDIFGYIMGKDSFIPDQIVKPNIF